MFLHGGIHKSINSLLGINTGTECGKVLTYRTYIKFETYLLPLIPGGSRNVFGLCPLTHTQPAIQTGYKRAQT